ncbi:hypothetical protein [Thioclava sp. GXIMD4215]|uniref:hypothetical protein n=1 Tax=Thioclava sp. GXIMD4215 TaxID=3131928 RepID=UPI00311AC3CE
MADFSSTNEIDNPCLPCQQGNIFLADYDSAARAPNLTGTVDGRSTPVLQTGEAYTLLNTPEGTANKLLIEVDGTTTEVIANIKDFGDVIKPSDFRVFVKTYGENRQMKRQRARRERRQEEYKFNTDEDTIFTMEAPWCQLPEGDISFDIETLNTTIIEQLSDTIGKIFSVSFTNAEAFATSWYASYYIEAVIRSGSYVGDINASYKEILTKQLLNNPQTRLAARRDFLNVILRGKTGKVFYEQGVKMISFVAPHAMGKFLNKTYYPAAKLHFIDIDVEKGSLAKNASKEIVNGLKGATNRLLLIIGLILTVFTALADSDNFKDAIVKVGAALVVFAISYIISQAIMGLLRVALVTLAAAALGAGAAGAAVIVAGIVVAAAVGFLLDRLGVTNEIAAALKKLFFGVSGAPVQTFPIGTVSSARMRGQTGSVRAGYEMNALDVISETNAIQGR